MSTFAQLRNVSNSMCFRWCGRAAGVVLMAISLLLVAGEVATQGLPYYGLYLQAAGLAIVFTGYIGGWWNELFGGVVAIAGTVLYFAMCVVTLQGPPRPETLWFAVPGICYLLARHHAQVENNGASNET